MKIKNKRKTRKFEKQQMKNGYKKPKFEITTDINKLNGQLKAKSEIWKTNTCFSKLKFKKGTQ